MAEIYLNNVDKVDRGTLEAVLQLPDDCVALADFRIPRTPRHVEFFVAKFDRSSSALVLVVVINESRPLRGTVDSVWEYEDELHPGVWHELPPQTGRDRNPLQQAISSATALGEWIGSMRALLEADASPAQEPLAGATVVPVLLLPFANPRNQLETGSFAIRYDSYDEFVHGLIRFHDRRRSPVTRGMIRRMADNLGLRNWQPPREPESAQLQRLSAQISALQRDVQEIKRLLTALTSGAPSRAIEPARPPAERPVSSAEREAAIEALVDVVRELRANGAPRVFTQVSEEIRLRYGELPNERIPYERFKDFVQDAQRRGKIRLVRVGPVYHVLLADEPIQTYVESVRREPEFSRP